MLLNANLAGEDLQHFRVREIEPAAGRIAVLIDRHTAQPVKMLLAEKL